MDGRGECIFPRQITRAVNWHKLTFEKYSHSIVDNRGALSLSDLKSCGHKQLDTMTVLACVWKLFVFGMMLKYADSFKPSNCKRIFFSHRLSCSPPDQKKNREEIQFVQILRSGIRNADFGKFHYFKDLEEDRNTSLPFTFRGSYDSTNLVKWILSRFVLGYRVCALRNTFGFCNESWESPVMKLYPQQRYLQLQDRFKRESKTVSDISKQLSMNK